MRELDELLALANEKGALYWKARGQVLQGCVSAVTGQASEAVQIISSGLTSYQSTGAIVELPTSLSSLSAAYVQAGNIKDAWRCVGEAMAAIEATEETWYEAEVNRIAGEIALLQPEPDGSKAEAYFERALAVAREQLAKSLGTSRRNEPRASLA